MTIARPTATPARPRCLSATTRRDPYEPSPNARRRAGERVERLFVVEAAGDQAQLRAPRRGKRQQTEDRLAIHDLVAADDLDVAAITRGASTNFAAARACSPSWLTRVTVRSATVTPLASGRISPRR